MIVEELSRSLVLFIELMLMVASLLGMIVGLILASWLIGRLIPPWWMPDEGDDDQP